MYVFPYLATLLSIVCFKVVSSPWCFGLNYFKNCSTWLMDVTSNFHGHSVSLFAHLLTQLIRHVWFASTLFAVKLSFPWVNDSLTAKRVAYQVGKLTVGNFAIPLPRNKMLKWRLHQCQVQVNWRLKQSGKQLICLGTVSNRLHHWQE